MTAFGRCGTLVASGILALSLAFTPATAAASWEDSTIQPGETISLELSDSSAASPAQVSNINELPAGWSAWTQNGVISVAAPLGATAGETATLTLVNDGTVIDEVKLTVAGTAAASAPKSSWFDSFLYSLSKFFS